MIGKEVTDAAVLADLLAQGPAHEALLSLNGAGTCESQPLYQAQIEKGR